MPSVRTTAAFDAWIDALLDRSGRAQILRRIVRLSQGNPGDVAPVGQGVSELRIHVGPGYRVYFVERADGGLVILLGGRRSRAPRLGTSHGPGLWQQRSEEGAVSGDTRPTTRTAPFDVANHLRTPEESAAYLTEVLREEDAAEFRRALGDVARSASMKAVAERAGVGYQSLYKSLSETGNPSFDTVMRVMSALGLGMAAVAKPGTPEAA